MSSVPDLVARVRRKMKDRSTAFLVLSAAPTADVSTNLQLEAGMVNTLFPSPGATIEWVGAAERAYVSAVDPDTDIITVLRGAEGTAKALHNINERAVRDPRFAFADVQDELNGIVTSELWPYVWVPKETTLTYQSLTDYYVPAGSATDIEQVSYAYQLTGGILARVHVTWLGREIADAANFPNGAFVIPYALDVGSIYVGYRAKPTVDNLTPELEDLLITGTVARMLGDDETAAVGGDRPMLEGRVPAGARQRAGLIRWAQFETSRSRLQAHLSVAEQERRSRS